MTLHPAIQSNAKRCGFLQARHITRNITFHLMLMLWILAFARMTGEKDGERRNDYGVVYVLGVKLLFYMHDAVDADGFVRGLSE